MCADDRNKSFLRNLNTVRQLDLDAWLTLQSEQHSRSCVDIEQCIKTDAGVVKLMFLFFRCFFRNFDIK